MLFLLSLSFLSSASVAKAQESTFSKHNYWGIGAGLTKVEPEGSANDFIVERV